VNVWELLGTTEGKSLTNWLTETPLTSTELILAAGALLVLAAVLLWMHRRTRIAVDSSGVSEELMIYLARIANALERPLPQGPSTEDVTREVLSRLEQMANAKPNGGKVKEIPQSMLGRVYRTED
jgi:hypothetical protein